MAGSKARSRNRPASGKSGRAAASKSPNRSGTGGGSSTRPASSQQAADQVTTDGQPTATAGQPKLTAAQKAQASRAARYQAAVAPEPERAAGPPLWLQIVSLVLALIGLGISIYETWAHYNGSHLFACSGTGTFNCSAVITSPQSMVFGVIPVAILGLVFYVFVVAIMTPWAWQMQRREVAWLRLGSMIVGMGFVMYLIYAELYQIGDVCEYCSGVHIVTFLLFCITVVSAAIWGLGAAPKRASRAAAA
jgi:uncharacterized membrane protein